MNFFFPGPLKIWQSFLEVSTEGYQGNTLFVHVFTSVNRILAAFIMACIVGIPMGVLMGASKIARALLNPLIEFYRPLPPLGLYTLLVMWLGIGEESKTCASVFSSIARANNRHNTSSSKY